MDFQKNMKHQREKAAEAKSQQRSKTITFMYACMYREIFESCMSKFLFM